MNDDGALVWLPFDPADLGTAPDSLQYVVSEPGAAPPAALDEVEIWVPPYFTRFSPELLPQMPKLRVIQTLTAGYEHVLPHLPADIRLFNGGGIHDTSTAELAVALTLAALRDIPRFVREQDRAEWGFDWVPGLADKRVLILGHGRIGQAVERRLKPFEVDIVRVASTARDGVHGSSELPDLLPEVDVVIVIVPMSEATRGLVDAGFLGAMKPGALLVNVARGGIVDTDALVEALTRGHVRAALDVTDPEPLPPDHPLWRAPGVLISPHTGGASSAMWPRAHRLVRDQLTRYAAGEPLANQVAGPPQT